MIDQNDIIVATLPEDDTPPLSAESVVVELSVEAPSDIVLVVIDVSSTTVLVVFEVSSITVLVVMDPSLELLEVLSVAVVSSGLVLLVVELSSLETGVIVFSYNTFPSILINLIVNSPSSDTKAWPKDCNSTTEGARFAQRSYPKVKGPCSVECSQRHQCNYK